MQTIERLKKMIALPTAGARLILSKEALFRILTAERQAKETSRRSPGETLKKAQEGFSFARGNEGIYRAGDSGNIPPKSSAQTQRHGIGQRNTAGKRMALGQTERGIADIAKAAEEAAGIGQKRMLRQGTEEGGDYSSLQQVDSYHKKRAAGQSEEIRLPAFQKERILAAARRTKEEEPGYNANTADSYPFIRQGKTNFREMRTTERARKTKEADWPERNYEERGTELRLQKQESMEKREITAEITREILRRVQSGTTGLY